MSYEIVVSTENNWYSMWQAMLCHYSCVRHLRVAPLVVVHSDTRELLPGFRMIEYFGGRVQRARNYRQDGGIDYAARNTPGTLQVACTRAKYIVLIDPDVVFLRHVNFHVEQVHGRMISFDEMNYLVVENYEDHLKRACRHAGVPLDTLRKKGANGGAIPHIIPRAIQHEVAYDWLRCIDYFADDHPVPTLSPWIASMWALVLTMHRLGLQHTITRFCTTNCDGHELMRDRNPGSYYGAIHYTHGTDFKKHDYLDAIGALETVWEAKARPDSVDAVICDQLHSAARFYGIDGTMRWLKGQMPI